MITLVGFEGIEMPNLHCSALNFSPYPSISWASPVFTGATDAEVLSQTLQKALNITKPQGNDLVKLVQLSNQRPYRVGKLPTGEIYLITSILLSGDFSPEPRFKDYDSVMKVYFGQPNQVTKLTIENAVRFLDGDTTIITTTNGKRFHFPPNFTSGIQKPLINGQSVTVDILL